MKTKVILMEKRVSALIPVDIHRALQARAKAENRRPCYVIADAIALYLANAYNAGLINLDGEALDSNEAIEFNDEWALMEA